MTQDMNRIYSIAGLYTTNTVQDFLIGLDMKPCMHLVEILRIGGAGKWDFVFVFCFWFLVIGFFQKIYFCFFSINITMAFTWGSVYFCTMEVLFRILNKALFKLISTSFHVQYDQKILDSIYYSIVIHSIICGCNTLFYRSNILLNSLLENWSEE